MAFFSVWFSILVARCDVKRISAGRSNRVSMTDRNIPARRNTHMRLDMRLSVTSNCEAIGRPTRREYPKSVDVPHQFPYYYL